MSQLKSECLYMIFVVLILSFPFHSVSDVDIRLMVWDTAGQEEFDSITKAYYRGEDPLTYWRPTAPHTYLSFKQ